MKNRVFLIVWVINVQQWVYHSRMWIHICSGWKWSMITRGITSGVWNSFMHETVSATNIARGCNHWTDVMLCWSSSATSVKVSEWLVDSISTPAEGLQCQNQTWTCLTKQHSTRPNCNMHIQLNPFMLWSEPRVPTLQSKFWSFSSVLAWNTSSRGFGVFLFFLYKD